MRNDNILEAKRWLKESFEDLRSAPQVPSEIYTKGQSEDAIRIAKEIFKFVENKIQ